MKQYLQSYQISLRTIGPVFVGSGREIGKKEYIFLDKKRVGIVDSSALYAEMVKRGRAREFEEYLLKNRREDMTVWLRNQRIPERELLSCVRYTMDCGDAVLEKGANRLQIMEHVKDPYGSPYIPGSSLKGMFRTILLADDIARDPKKYAVIKSAMKGNTLRGGYRNSYLKADVAKTESMAFRTLQKNEKKPSDPLNDVMQGFIVSDSEPLETKDLVLCQKVDRHTDGREKTLPLLRECIKPDTEIRCTLTIDTKVCPWSKEKLLQAVDRFMEIYHESFASAFAGMEERNDGCVYLGGGCGFVSKTVIYPMYGRQEGLPVVQKIFDVTVKNSRQHKHDRDREYGASPHIIKCTRYQGQTLQMGLCKIEKMETV